VERNQLLQPHFNLMKQIGKRKKTEEPVKAVPERQGAYLNPP